MWAKLTIKQRPVFRRRECVDKATILQYCSTIVHVHNSFKLANLVLILVVQVQACIIVSYFHFVASRIAFCRPLAVDLVGGHLGPNMSFWLCS